MQKSKIYMHEIEAGLFTEIRRGEEYHFEYHKKYNGPPISLSMPTTQRLYKYSKFPPFFDGLLPEGMQLEGLLKLQKIDRRDYFRQLLAVGGDLVGAVTVKEIKE